MADSIVKIIETEQLTHDVKRFRIEKPEGYEFRPGQATGVTINTPELKKMRRSFTFTGRNDDPYLEFTIKIYPEHNGLTKELDRLVPGNEIVIGSPWGAISYKGKGIFIAGGAGITPFIAIFRDLKAREELQGNLLLFANKTKADIIMEQEFREMLGGAFINILSEEKADGYYHGFIDEEFIRAQVSNYSQNFYLCGPPPMMQSLTGVLSRLGVDRKAVTMDI
ncbi:MAG: flavodoxin reductase [Bacteroidales bacterium]|nr:flavodoxin reductase [Bacteroidales bacterium]